MSICIACGSPEVETLLELPKIPVVCNDLHLSAAAAQQASCGDMKIEFCRSCTHFYNSEYDESRVSYSSNYETSLHFSTVFQEYAANLVKKLVDEHGIRNRRVLEIGCGRGEFLNSLCNAGSNSGVGFDTSYDGGATIGARNAQLEIRAEYFDNRLELEPFDLLVLQQVLEHISAPQPFLQRLIAHPAVAQSNALIYLEVPNGLYTFENDGIWDLIYEHVSYFTVDSLHHLVTSCGCQVIESGVSYGGQYLYVLARAGSEAQPAKHTEGNYNFVDGFKDRFEAKVQRWIEILSLKLPKVEKTFVWGAGSKGITFCNVIDPDAKLGGLIDRHPNKVGKYIATTRSRIFPLTELNPDQVERVIVMNSIYAEEIRSDLEAAGFDAEVINA